MSATYVDSTFVFSSVICPYCQAKNNYGLKDSPMLESCFGCDQIFVIEWSIKLDKIRKIEGMNKV